MDPAWTLLKIFHTYLNKTAKLLFYTISKTTSQDLGFLDPQYPPSPYRERRPENGIHLILQRFMKIKFYLLTRATYDIFVRKWQTYIILYIQYLFHPICFTYLCLMNLGTYLLYIIIIQFSFSFCETLSYLHLWNISQSQLWIINI